MRTRKGLAAWPAAVLLCLSTTLIHPTITQAEDPLYKRIGGYDAIAAVTDAFIGKLVKEPSIAPMFAGHSKDSLGRTRQLIVDQICALTGGPCVYIGRDMKTAHAGLGITEEQWTTAAKDLAATLDEFKVPAKEKGEFLALVTSLKPEIVEKK